MTSSLNAQRKSNLQSLLRDHGGATSVSKLMGQSGPSFLSQLAGGHRNISDKTARKLEEVTGKPLYWLDEAHTSKPGNLFEKPPATTAAERTATSTEVSFVGASVKAVQEAADEQGIRLTAEKFSKIVEMVYANAVNGGQIDTDLVENLVLLAKE